MLGLGISVLILTASCMTPRTVEPGTYYDPSGSEHLTIAGTTVSLHIRIEPEDEPAWFLTKTYELRVAADGGLQFHPIASTEFFLGVGRFVWYWDGEVIRRTDAKTGVVTEFARTRP
jgi:hypothetical protein